MRRIAAICVGLLAVACGGSQSQFPSQAEVEALRTQPTQPPTFGEPDVLVDTWTLEGPLPD